MVSEIIDDDHESAEANMHSRFASLFPCCTQWIFDLKSSVLPLVSSQIALGLFGMHSATSKRSEWIKFCYYP